MSTQHKKELRYEDDDLRTLPKVASPLTQRPPKKCPT
jgi:hypothetical protein